MKYRLGIGFVCVCVAMPAVAQVKPRGLPKLEPAIGIDVRVKTVDWHPHAKALLYTREEESGTGIGFYVPGDKEGKVLIHLPKDDTYQSIWFAGRSAALVWTTHPLAKDVTRFTFYLVDPQSKQTLTVYEEEGTAKTQLSFDVDASPLLRHAIITRTDTSGTKHLVLPDGSNKFVSALDLDKAAKSGYSGPTWSTDGTAIYGNSGGRASLNGENLTQLTLDLSTALGERNQDRQAIIVLSGSSSTFTDSGLTFRVKFLPPAPAVGASVLELMPTNAFLRAVKFKGPWEDKEPTIASITPESRLSRLDFGVSRGYASSWWLSLPDTKTEEGILVAADASEAFLAPENLAVAYITNGALFVRTVKEK